MNKKITKTLVTKNILFLFWCDAWIITDVEFESADGDARCSSRPGQSDEVLAADVAREQRRSNLRNNQYSDEHLSVYQQR
jgi:hypothetical protein